MNHYYQQYYKVKRRWNDLDPVSGKYLTGSSYTNCIYKIVQAVL